MRRKKTGCYLFGVVLLALLLFFVPIKIYAQANTAIARGFQSNDTNLAPGALMSLTDTADTVTLADVNNSQQLVGILDDLPLLELDATDKQVQVVTGGVTYGLVSDINGEIKTGDKITTSPIRGVGMRAVESSITVGTAQSNFSSQNATEQEITQKDGSSKTVKISTIPIQVSVAFYQAPSEQTNLPPILNDLASTVTGGRQVSPVRIIVALLILLVALVSMAVLLYSSVKSSVISIGRNPLSEHAVYKSLWQIGLIVLGILLLTVLAIYLILTT